MHKSYSSISFISFFSIYPQSFLLKPCMFSDLSTTFVVFHLHGWIWQDLNDNQNPDFFFFLMHKFLAIKHSLLCATSFSQVSALPLWICQSLTSKIYARVSDHTSPNLAISLRTPGILKIVHLSYFLFPRQKTLLWLSNHRDTALSACLICFLFINKFIPSKRFI